MRRGIDKEERILVGFDEPANEARVTEKRQEDKE